MCGKNKVEAALEIVECLFRLMCAVDDVKNICFGGWMVDCCMNVIHIPMTMNIPLPHSLNCVVCSPCSCGITYLILFGLEYIVLLLSYPCIMLCCSV